jgi:CHAT domain
LIRHVRTEKPTVIHFSGHGSTKGIVLRSDDGAHAEVTGPSLQHFLNGRGVEFLVLNACYTKAQAEHVGSAVNAIVGTTTAVDDEAARRFSVAFYRAPGEGLSIRGAFRDGRDAVVLQGLPDVFWNAGELDRIPLGSASV